MIKLFSASSIIVLLVCTACNSADRKPAAAAESASVSLDQIKLTGLNGQPVDLSDYKGKTVFINFWATWCKPCREEMPSIQEAMKIVKDEKVEFLFASDEAIEQIEMFKAEHEYPFTYVKVENSPELSIMGLPTTFIFSPNGELIFSEMGYRKWDEAASINLILNKTRSK